jgi:hypothetical protein
MEPSVLMQNIIEAYERARHPLPCNNKLRRGRSHSVSSITEDLFANFLISNDSSIDMVRIDQPITLSGIDQVTNKRKKQIYPDLVVIRDNRIDALVDIKMDLGWNRDGLSILCKKHCDTIIASRGSNCHLKEGLDKTPLTLRFSEKLSYSIVIISGTNIPRHKFEFQLRECEKFVAAVEVFVLSDCAHPNTYSDLPGEILQKMEINLLTFERLKKKLVLPTG